MPTSAQQDREILSKLAADPNPPRQVMETIGVDHNDLAIWKQATADADNPLARKVENAVLFKVSEKKPEVNEQAVDFSTRFVAKNLLDGRTDLVVPYLKKQGFDVKVIPREPQDFTVGSKTGILGEKVKLRTSPSDQIKIRNPKTNQWGVLDPEGINFWDILPDLADVVGDIAEGAFSGTAAGLAAGAAAKTGPGALAAGSLASGAASGTFEGVKQGIAYGIGARDDISGYDVAFKTGLGLVTPLVLGLGGKAIRAVGQGSGKIANATGRAVLKPDADDIQAAAKVIGEGAEATPGQLFASKQVQKREQNIVKTLSNTWFGKGTRKQVEKNIEAVQSAADDLVKNQTALSKTDLGDKVLDEMSGIVAKKLEPAIETYEKVYGSFGTKFAKKQPIKEALASMKKEYAGIPEAQSYIGSLEKGLVDIKTLNQLRNWRRNIGKTIQRDAADFKQEIADRLYKPVTAARDLSIRDKGALKVLKEADGIYSETTETLKQVLGVRSKKAGSNVLAEFGDKNVSADVVKKILRNNDPKAMAMLKEQFPEAFELARTQKIKELAESAVSRVGGNIQPKRLAQNIAALEPETRALIFTGKELEKATALKKFTESLPEVLNPSGTAEAFWRLKFVAGEINALKEATLQQMAANSQLQNNIFNSIAQKLESSVATGVGVVGGKGLIPPEPQYLFKAQGLQQPATDNQGLKSPGGN